MIYSKPISLGKYRTNRLRVPTEIMAKKHYVHISECKVRTVIWI